MNRQTRSKATRRPCWRMLLWKMLFLLYGTFAPTLSSAGALRVALLSEAEVQGDAILLANLLPLHAPRAVRDAAGKIVLCTAPQLGAVRRFSRDAILAAIQRSGLPATSFAVPPTITVRRTARALTPEDVWPAIQSFLEKKPVAALRDLRPADLSLHASIAASDDVSKLAVTRLNFDAALHRAGFRLQMQNISGAQPFDVAVQFPKTPADAPRPWFQQITPAHPLNSSLADSAVLVDPRQSAHLRLHSDDSEMRVVVQPLQRGHLGETIRVRLRASGKTLQARVVGANALDATF